MKFISQKYKVTWLTLNTSLLVGLDAAGKTTILYKLKLGEIVTTIPTIGKFTSNQETKIWFLRSIKGIFSFNS